MKKILLSIVLLGALGTSKADETTITNEVRVVRVELKCVRANCPGKMKCIKTNLPDCLHECPLCKVRLNLTNSVYPRIDYEAK